MAQTDSGTQSCSQSFRQADTGGDDILAQRELEEYKQEFSTWIALASTAYHGRLGLLFAR